MDYAPLYQSRLNVRHNRIPIRIEMECKIGTERFFSCH
jgi:hypothetical protein